MPQRVPAQPCEVGGTFLVGHKLGSGTFGEIFHATDKETGEHFAVKVASTDRQPTLMREAAVLRSLQSVEGIPRIHYSAVEGDFSVMVMDLLGPSLEHIFALCGRKFCLKSVLMIANQMLYRIEYLHSRGIIHRDIKPSNCCIGNGAHASTIYLIDFGVSKPYRDPETKEHIPYQEHKKFRGTACFASANTHLGIEQSRRDDVESIGYVLVYLMCGRLPWQNIRVDSKDEWHHRIMEGKMSAEFASLCGDVRLGAYIDYCRRLGFHDRPDYGYLRRIFRSLMSEACTGGDFTFDWLQGGNLTGCQDAPADAAGCGGGDAGDGRAPTPPPGHGGVSKSARVAGAGDQSNPTAPQEVTSSNRSNADAVPGTACKHTDAATRGAAKTPGWRAEACQRASSSSPFLLAKLIDSFTFMKVGGRAACNKTSVAF